MGLEGFELTVKPTVDNFILVPQVLLLLNHRPLLLANSQCAHSKVLCLLDGSIGTGFGHGV
jgi:hypothetical protein